jgi:hypothetical protein
MPDNSDYFALAGEIMRPANPESMADRVKRHQKVREEIFETSFISYMNDQVQIPHDKEMVISQTTIDPDSKTVIIQYKLESRPDMNDLGMDDSDFERI